MVRAEIEYLFAEEIVSEADIANSGWIEPESSHDSLWLEKVSNKKTKTLAAGITAAGTIAGLAPLNTTYAEPYTPLPAKVISGELPSQETEEDDGVPSVIFIAPKPNLSWQESPLTPLLIDDSDANQPFGISGLGTDGISSQNNSIENIASVQGNAEAPKAQIPITPVVPRSTPVSTAAKTSTETQKKSDAVVQPSKDVTVQRSPISAAATPTPRPSGQGTQDLTSATNSETIPSPVVDTAAMPQTNQPRTVIRVEGPKIVKAEDDEPTPSPTSTPPPTNTPKPSPTHTPTPQKLPSPTAVEKTKSNLAFELPAPEPLPKNIIQEIDKRYGIKLDYRYSARALQRAWRSLSVINQLNSDLLEPLRGLKVYWIPEYKLDKNGNYLLDKNGDKIKNGTYSVSEKKLIYQKDTTNFGFIFTHEIVHQIRRWVAEERSHKLAFEKAIGKNGQEPHLSKYALTYDDEWTKDDEEYADTLAAAIWPDVGMVTGGAYTENIIHHPSFANKNKVHVSFVIRIYKN